MNPKQRFEDIELSAIDRADVRYKISRSAPDDRLLQSVREFGVMDPPLLVKKGVRLAVLLGHNRIEACAACGRERVPAYVLDDFDPGTYLRLALLKETRKELGPCGKLKLLEILAAEGSLPHERLAVIAERGLGVRPEFFQEKLRRAVLSLPDPLCAYLDSRDVAFKILRNLLRLPGPAVDWLASTAPVIGMRMNLFKGFIEMLSDLALRDPRLECLAGLTADPEGDRRQEEERLFDSLYRARYPRYCEIRDRADLLVKSLGAPGVQVEYPPYFEGDRLRIVFTLGKKEGFASLKARMEKIPAASLKELIDLL